MNSDRFLNEITSVNQRIFVLRINIWGRIIISKWALTVIVSNLLTRTQELYPYSFLLRFYYNYCLNLLFLQYSVNQKSVKRHENDELERDFWELRSIFVIIFVWLCWYNCISVIKGDMNSQKHHPIWSNLKLLSLQINPLKREIVSIVSALYSSFVCGFLYD